MSACTLSPADGALLKVLFRQLVERFGGTEAAAAELNITHQRISQLQSPHCPDQPTYVHTWPLEKRLRESIVNAGVAASVTGASGQHGDIGRESRQATYAAVALQQGVDEGVSRDELRARATRLARELDDVRRVLGPDEN